MFTRFLFEMGRDGVLPSAFARIHPTWRTPHVATMAAYVCTLVGLLLPSSLVFLFLAVNVPTMLKYMFNCFAAVGLVNHHPELHARAKVRLGRKAIMTWAYLGVACAIVIILAGLGADWRPYAVIGGWGVVGTVYWFVRGRHTVATMDDAATAVSLS
jgi:APA family basic amino acid/polyamine antiporter